MTDKKQKAAPHEPTEAVELPGKAEVPNLTVSNADDHAERAVTMLDYQGSQVVTYRVGDNRRKPSGGAS